MVWNDFWLVEICGFVEFRNGNSKIKNTKRLHNIKFHKAFFLVLVTEIIIPKLKRPLICGLSVIVSFISKRELPNKTLKDYKISGNIFDYGAPFRN